MENQSIFKLMYNTEGTTNQQNPLGIVSIVSYHNMWHSSDKLT
jgi:hypothetical protein